MTKSEWSDKQVEELLRQLPKVQDQRNPQDIYQNLSVKLKKRKRQTWVLPGIATAAAILLFFILIPNLHLFNGSNQSMDRVVEQRSNSSTNKKVAEKFAVENKESSPKIAQDADTAKVEFMKETNIKTAVYENEVGNGKVLTYWIPDQQAQILVPVSTIINDTGNKTWLELFNEKMSALKEEEWGLSEYYPLNAKLALDNVDNSILIDVPGNHTYGEGSTNESTFINALEKNVSSNSSINKIRFTTDGKEGIILGNTGELTEISVPVSQNHAYFFYNPKNQEIPFIIPSTETFTDIQTALDAMRNDQETLGLKASISPAFKFNVNSIKDRTLFLSIPKTDSLENSPFTVYSFEAILLTAKEFGVEYVKIDNMPMKNLGPFDLTKENKVPIAPNLRTLNDQP